MRLSFSSQVRGAPPTLSCFLAVKATFGVKCSRRPQGTAVAAGAAGLSGSPLLPCAMLCCGAGGLLQSQRSVGIFKKDAAPSAILLTPTAVLYVRTSPAGGLSAGAIAGIVVGCTAAVAALAAGAWLLRRRQLRRRKTELQQHKQQTEAGVAGTPPVSGSPKLQRMSDDIPLTALSPFEAVSASAVPFGPGPYSCLPSGTASSAGSGSRLPPLPPRPPAPAPCKPSAPLTQLTACTGWLACLYAGTRWVRCECGIWATSAPSPSAACTPSLAAF